MTETAEEGQRKALDAAQRVVAVCEVLRDFTETGFDEFAADMRTQWAVETGLIRIGEAVNRIPTEILGRFQEQPWRLIVALRNLAAHQYDDIDPRRVWRTVTIEVPALRAYLSDVVIPKLNEWSSLRRTVMSA